MVPDPDTCYQLMDEYGMYPHIRDHSLVVARVAALLVRGVNLYGWKLDPDLTLAGALLHDIAKTECLEKDCWHDLRGGEICRRLGYGEVAEIVEEHVTLKKGEKQPLSEKMMVYYADKRVNHDRIVSLEERLISILERYAEGDRQLEQTIRDNFRVCFKVETRIFKYLTFTPAEVEDLIESGREEIAV
ncbi:MAG: HD domain-containing protein [Desulfobia sp.]